MIFLMLRRCIFRLLCYANVKREKLIFKTKSFKSEFSTNRRLVEKLTTK